MKLQYILVLFVIKIGTFINVVHHILEDCEAYRPSSLNMSDNVIVFQMYINYILNQLFRANKVDYNLTSLFIGCLLKNI